MRQYSPRQLLLTLFASFLTLSFSVSLKAQDMHVFSDGEFAVFDELALNMEPGATWTTNRSGTPGYFSAVNDAFFSGASNGTSNLVDGYVKYYRDNSATVASFTFPLGQATVYRPLTLSGTMPTNAGFAVAWFGGDPDITTDPTDGTLHSRSSRGPGVIAVLDAGFWDWQTVSGTAAGMRITVSIPNVSAQAATQNLILVGWNGTNWVNLSGAAGAGPYGGHWADGNTEGAALSGTWQAGISALAIGSVSSILPLKLESFTGNVTECNAQLSWKTSEEINTSHFIVQASDDGIAWKAVSRIAAQGTGNGKTYTFTTFQSALKKVYRLQMVDRDGQTTYSQNVSLHSSCGQDKAINVSPNPVTVGTLQLVLQTPYHGKATLMLRNSNGQVLQNKTITLRQGLNILGLETSGLAAGAYLVSIMDVAGNSLFATQKIIKR